MSRAIFPSSYPGKKTFGSSFWNGFAQNFESMFFGELKKMYHIIVRVCGCFGGIPRRRSDPSLSHFRIMIFQVHKRVFWNKTGKARTKKSKLFSFSVRDPKKFFSKFLIKPISNCRTLASLFRNENSGRKYVTVFGHALTGPSKTSKKQKKTTFPLCRVWVLFPTSGVTPPTKAPRVALSYWCTRPSSNSNVDLPPLKTSGMEVSLTCAGSTVWAQARICSAYCGAGIRVSLHRSHQSRGGLFRAIHLLRINPIKHLY